MPNVTVSSPAIIKVQVGPNPSPQTTSIGYGGPRTIKSSTDLSMGGAQQGDVIVYQANTNSFIVEPAAAVIPSLDSGFF